MRYYFLTGLAAASLAVTAAASPAPPATQGTATAPGAQASTTASAPPGAQSSSAGPAKSTTTAIGQEPKVPDLSPKSFTLTVAYPGESVSGKITVHASTLPDGGLKLHAEPLKNGENAADVHFPDSAGGNSTGLTKEACVKDSTDPTLCVVRFEISPVRAAGAYSGTIDVTGANDTVRLSIPVQAARPDPLFQPVVMGEPVKNDAIQFDATDATWFVVTIQNPTGSPWRRFKVKDCSDEQANVCTDFEHALAMSQQNADSTDASHAGGIIYSPSVFALFPGQSQQVEGRIVGDLPSNPAPRFLQIVDDREASLSRTTLVMLKKLTPSRSRFLYLAAAVTLGSVVSVLLNIVFPFSQSKADVQKSLQRVAGLLPSYGTIGPAVRDALSSEIGRNRLILKGLWFYSFGTDATLQEVRQAVTTLTTLATTAREVSIVRAQLDSDVLPVRTKLAVESLLSLAEDALIDFDTATAAAKLAEAVKVRAAVDFAGGLAPQLARDIARLTVAGGAAPVPAPQPVPPNQGNLEAAPPGIRPPEIARLLANLRGGLANIGQMAPDELLQVEHDFYIADAWIGSVEPALQRDEQRFADFATDLLACLLRNPTSRHAQLSLALIRSFMTPTDIQDALTANRARLDCDPRPQYFELIDCRFEFNDPCIASFPAARRIVSYRWEFDDNTSAPEDFDRCKHYFLPGRTARGATKGPETRTIKVFVRFPGKSETEFSQAVTLRPKGKRAVELSAMQGVSFALSTAIAVLVAFSTQYSGALPEVIDWRTYMTAFLFGVALDQIRNKTTSSTSGTASTATQPVTTGVATSTATGAPAK